MQSQPPPQGTPPRSEHLPEHHHASGVGQALQCHICSRSYERADHLHRHLDSHRNQRLFQCQKCPASFNRKDLLTRHHGSHLKGAKQGGSARQRRAERVYKACEQCVRSKDKCDNSRPCKRCQKKNLVCTTNTNKLRFSLPPSVVGHSHETPFRHGSQQLQSRLDVLAPVDEMQQDQDTVSMDQSINTHVLQEAFENDSSVRTAFDIPPFFEHIMVPEPDWMSGSFVQPPANLTTWLQDNDWFENGDLFANDFPPTVDHTLEMSCELTTAESFDVGAVEPARAKEHETEDARRRHVAFQRSPWLWNPERNQHAFSEYENEALDEQHINLGSSPHQPHASDVVVPDQLSFVARDRMFHLVSKTAPASISITSFPSSENLEKLIKAGISKRAERDAWIHPYTFRSAESRPELLIALVAAGCICFGIPSVNRTGLLLQEIVRLSLRDLVEKDDSMSQDLQYLQASMLWLEMGAFCGLKRKMIAAESSLPGLVTALRRAGRLDNARRLADAPTTLDGPDELDRKWRNWVEDESYKRLVYHLWEHDIDMAVIKHRQPLISYAEVTLPLPAPRFLWLAPSAEAWRDHYINSKYEPTAKSLRELLLDESIIVCMPPNLDTGATLCAYLHGLAAQLWEHSQQARLFSCSTDPSLQLWSQTRQQKLYQSLQNLTSSLSSTPAVTRLFHEFLHMYIHVDLDTVARFAGKCGEDEAHRAYVKLQSWVLEKGARIAVLHAGQVIQAGRAVPPFQLRGADSLAIYHAIMVLWTYSMLMRDRANKTVPCTPTRDAGSEEQPVFLDDEHSGQQAAVNAFIFTGSGKPCLHMTSGYPTPPESATPSIGDGICDLQSPSQVMQAGVKLLDNTHPGSNREDGPPLLRALCRLMEDLGGLR